MDKLNKPPEENRPKAIINLLKVAQKRSARLFRDLIMIISSVLIVSNTDITNIPPGIVTFVNGMGLNLLSNLIDRVAEESNEDEILRSLNSALDKLSDDLRTELAEFTNIQKTIQYSNDEVISTLSIKIDQILATAPTYQVHTLSIRMAIEKFIDELKQTVSKNTVRSYKNAMNVFISVLEDPMNELDLRNTRDLGNKHIIWLFARSIKHYAPRTRNLYLTALSRFYKFIYSEHLILIDIEEIYTLIHNYKQYQDDIFSIPDIPRKKIENLLDFMIDLEAPPKNKIRNYLRHKRDLAFLITLADTGLRVHEACNLRRGDVDWNEGKAVIIGKGDRQAVIRFSTRSLQALKAYLNARARLDGGSGKPLTSLPLFARHDKRAGDKVKPISTRTGRNIVTERVRQALGERAVGTITPHSFRHYFVTTVLQASGNLKLAQELARHRNIQITQRYAHLSDDELDRGYHEIFNQ
jgi:integrase/recombinase XerC